MTCSLFYAMPLKKFVPAGPHLTVQIRPATLFAATKCLPASDPSGSRSRDCPGTILLNRFGSRTASGVLHRFAKRRHDPFGSTGTPFARCGLGAWVNQEI